LSANGNRLQQHGMPEPARYSAVEALRDGRPFEIRAFKADDRADMLDAVARTSADSLYRRFFTVKRSFSEREMNFFMNVDFIRHVALVAVVEEGGRPAIVGGGRYVVVEPGKAEVAFAVVDQYQGQGIGAALIRHLAQIARAAGLHEFVAEVLPENAPMLKLFEKCGLEMSRTSDTEVVHVTLRLA
jgi:RimJ/RimL family protein N-acetyltransferase